MKTQNNNKLEMLIESRLQLQSTQRELLSLGIQYPFLNFFKTKQFSEIYTNMSSLKKKSFFNVVAGPINAKRAENLINSYLS